jgi:hypothetical protein
MGLAHTLTGGALGLIAAAGIGSGLIRLLGPVPARWRLASSLVSGVAVVDLWVMLTLFFGGGVEAVKLVGLVATVTGGCVLLLSWKHLSFGLAPKIARRSDCWFVAVILAVVAINLMIALAPSTKIDELHYHMLLPKRVVEDGGLYFYRLPIQLAMFPHTAYQLGLSAAYAAGFPEAGNVLSWGLGASLVLLVAGLSADLTGSTTAGWMTGAISAVGLYPAVWHVSSGPHALGDLATVTASCLALLPDSQSGKLKPTTRLTLVCLSAYTAASTKLSILPLAAAITLLGTYRAAGQIGWKKALGIAFSVWSVLYGPILLWTTLQCGSPLGPVMAATFHSHYFGPEALAALEGLKGGIWEGGAELLTWLALSVSLGIVAAFAVVAYAAWKRERTFKILFGFVCGQVVLIVWLLPHEFRFLGGLQYVVLVMGAGVFWPSQLGRRLMARWWTVLLGLCIPWLAVQVYYARPFVKVVSGVESREAFLRQYVAFTEDFRTLDRILPANAVLYVVNSRLPSYYAPRPVIFTLEDLRGREPLYRFTVGDEIPARQDALICTETIYENADAVAVVYRTPGRAAEHEPLKVERCDVVRAVRPES